MSAAPETKYTDRDVRESPDLVALVYEYLETYSGEFQYLIDCKMRLANGQELSTGHVRGVLNCMRVDPRVFNLPEPLPPLDEGDVVVPIRSRRRASVKPACKNEDFHSHTMDDFRSMEYCPGKYPINREVYAYTRPANVKRGLLFVAAKTGGVVHKVALAPHNADLTWYPRQHEYGWKQNPKMRVRILCMYPRWVNEPRLYESPDGVPDNRTGKINEGTLRLCKRCEKL